MLFHVNFSNFIHNVSIFLTLSLAIWRFIMIRFPTKSVNICTTNNCKNVLALGFGECLVLEHENLTVFESILFSNLVCRPAGQMCFFGIQNVSVETDRKIRIKEGFWTYIDRSSKQLGKIGFMLTKNCEPRPLEQTIFQKNFTYQFWKWVKKNIKPTYL